MLQIFYAVHGDEEYAYHNSRCSGHCHRNQDRADNPERKVKGEIPKIRKCNEQCKYQNRYPGPLDILSARTGMIGYLCHEYGSDPYTRFAKSSGSPAVLPNLHDVPAEQADIEASE